MHHNRRPLTRPSPLPIDAVQAELVAAVRDTGSAVLVAPPGAGKTTRVPVALANAGLGPVVVLEPRRLAARAAARRVAEECGWTVGDEVGYHVRFERRASRRTRVLFCTEGVVLRRLQDDPFLEGVGCLVFDEFHERNLDGDLALAMARRVRAQVREDLRIVVMSATLQAEPVATFLDAPIVESAGRLHPVEMRFLPAQSRSGQRERLPEHVARAVHLAAGETQGDVLAFLPGVGEIRRTRERLVGALPSDGPQVHELYGDLAPEQQDRALRRGQGRRVVLATNVAESSVTVQGVRAVVDAGLARVPRHDPGAGLDRLELTRIDRAAADQRAGRAGREAPGLCLRLWSAADDRALAAHLEPEVRRLDLAGPVLELACWGEADPAAFPWFEAPDARALQRAQELLRRLGALDARGQATDRGRALRALPLHPRLASVVVEGRALGAARDAATAAALLAERDPFHVPRGVTLDASDSDILDRVAALDEHARSGRTSFAFGELRRGAGRQLARARDQILRRAEAGQGRAGTDPSKQASGPEEDGLLRALLAGFPDRLCRRRADDPRRGVMIGGRGVRLSPSSAVSEGELFVALDVTDQSGESLVRSASSVDRAWVAGGHTRTEVQAVFDPKSGRVVGRRRELLGELVLQEVDHPLEDAAAAEQVLLEAAREDVVRALGLDRPPLAELRARLVCLAEWRPELELPPIDDAAFTALLPSLVVGRRSFADLAQAPTADVLLGTLRHDQRAALQRDAPERIAVPSGSHLRLTYEPGRPPVLAVRIQEVFGLARTPTVAGGRVPVLLHLLAPNGRPQQVTDDLESFWRDTYHVVRKDLRGRYPKHDWPEDPSSARASARPRRRR